ADTELIYTFSKQTLGFANTIVDIKPTRHLITKVVRYIWIIFNYGVLKNNYKPPIAAFWVLDRSTFLTTRFYHLGLKKEVNNMVDISRGYSAKLPT
ncbi:hypothetical protein V2W45_1254073, partial [Cenococcum geophilum]